MRIQSLSIHVPTNGCVNDCAFCVSRMHESPFENRMHTLFPDFSQEYEEAKIRPYDYLSLETQSAHEDYLRRLRFCKNNGVNTVIFTGDGEPMQNRDFLKWFAAENEKIGFEWLELQTSGNMLVKKGHEDSVIYDTSNLSFLKRFVGVSTISLSVSNIFDDENNWDVQNTPEKHRVPLAQLCGMIKTFHFNLRISMNMTNVYEKHSPANIFHRLKQLGADQVTFRKLYISEDTISKQNTWIEANGFDDYYLDKIEEGIVKEGKFLGILPFGAEKYSVNKITTVVDNNCMDKPRERVEPDTYKYLILRPNCKLYSSWDDNGSLIF
jgi:hypothetical protein